MSGHNKWSTIKHKKAATDAKRGKVFSKIAREIMVVARQGGGDPEANPTLRTLIQKGRSVNMPMDNIDRAIKKGTGGDDDGIQFDELSYEGYAAGGVALVIQVLTDNKNRTAAEIRHAFSKHGGNMAGPGSVSRTFHRKGIIQVDTDKTGEDELMEIVLEAGAEDMTRDGDQFIITTDPTVFMDVVDALNAANIEIANSEVSLISEIYMPVTDKSQAGSILRFIEALEDLDDVQNVYSNFDIDDAMMEELNQD